MTGEGGNKEIRNGPRMTWTKSPSSYLRSACAPPIAVAGVGTPMLEPAAEPKGFAVALVIAHEGTVQRECFQLSADHS